MKQTIENWTIDLSTDEDGHLTLGINHIDKSEVMIINEDLSTNESEWVDRFTTRIIEDTHKWSPRRR
jgi:hypothetical protein